MPTLTAFERSPDRGRGLARGMRVRWALEEVGQPCDVRLGEPSRHLATCIARGEGRPVYQRAFAGQWAVFNAVESTG